MEHVQQAHVSSCQETRVRKYKSFFETPYDFWATNLHEFAHADGVVPPFSKEALCRRKAALACIQLKHHVPTEKRRRGQTVRDVG